MKKYILGRLIRSIISIFLVVTIAIVMVYTMVPRDSVFNTDPMISKLNSKPDEKTRYKYNTWQKLGYLTFIEQKDMCAEMSDNYAACMVVGSEDSLKAKEYFENKGWDVGTFTVSGLLYASKDNPVHTLVFNWFSSLIRIDHPWTINDPGNPDLERKVYFASDHNGMPALKCSGCKNNFMLYLDGNFPFIHQNIISLHFGISYPSFGGVEVSEVFATRQGSNISADVTFPTGYQTSSPNNLHKCRYKPVLDKLDLRKFNDNYADCLNNQADSSMMMTSFIFGIFALILSYAIALPSGIMMAENKDKISDKIGTVYINFMIAVPSLAFIFFARQIGTSLLKLPEKFPHLGAQDVRSYILPIIILGLLSTAGLMIWIRRYMIDQSSSDYVKFARAKGLSQREIFTTHILRNAIIPIVQGLPSSIIMTISGAVMTETVFSIPGMGKMLPDAITHFNNSMIIALTFIFTSLSILSLVLGDILVTFVDPRIQLETKGGSR